MSIQVFFFNGSETTIREGTGVETIELEGQSGPVPGLRVFDKDHKVIAEFVWNQLVGWVDEDRSRRSASASPRSRARRVTPPVQRR
jgi:hypothetical protein